MKQKLFSKLWLRVGMLVAVMTTALSGTARAEEESVTFSAQGYTNAEAVESYEGENFSITFDKGTNSNAPKYYTSGEAIRCYGSNSFTVSSESTITKIVLTFGNEDGTNEITTEVGTYSSGTWTGSAQSVTFTIGGTSGHRRLAGVTVTYTSGDTPSGPVINAGDVTLSYDATTGGEIAYSIDNPVAGTSLTAATEADWISNITVTEQAVTFTVTANDGNADRTATITLTYGEVTKEVTVTQEHYVANYATLPFEFNGGIADIAETSGLTQNGLGNDYGSSPKLRFDNTGDYVVLAFNESPGVLTFDIKGNSFSDGTFTVQTSKDGEIYTNLKAYTALGSTQSEVFKNLGEDVRYIKWIYTEKVSGNVGLGNIELDAYAGPVPTITVTPTRVAFEATSEQSYLMETLDIEYNDIDVENSESFEVQFYDAEDEEQDAPEWLDVSVTGNNDDGYNVQCVAGNNDGEARTAYFKVYALDNDANLVYSELITVTQDAYVEPAVPGNWVETALADITPNDVFVIVADNGNTFAMSNDKGTQAAPDAVAVTVTEGTLSGDVPTNIQWQLSIGEAGYSFYPYGDTEKWLYCTNTNDGVRVGTNANKVFTLNATSGYLFNTATSRYIGVYNSHDWRCYTTVNNNIKDQTFKFYKKLVADTETITLNASGYATFASTSVADFSAAEDYSAWAITGVDGTKISFSPITGAVPAGTGVLLKGEGNAEIEITYTAAAGTAVADNLLVGIVTPTTIAAGDYYGLSGDKFVKVNAGTVKAGKALLPASLVGGSGAKAYTFSFDDDATGIANVGIEVNANEAIYNLAGQRLQKMQRGINIVNGKKVLR